MSRTMNSPVSLAKLLVLCALAASACAQPPTIPTPTVPPPTLAPTLAPPATATVAPPPTSPPATAVPTQAAEENAPVPATSIALHGPNELAFAADGTMYLSQCGDTDVAPQILKVDQSGMLSMVVSTFLPSESNLSPFASSGDGGPALTAGIGCAIGLAFDHDGNLLVADFFGNRIRRIDPNGIISTIAGNGEASGFSGDGGPATQAQLGHPTNVAIDAAGDLYIVDSGNGRIRKVDSQGIITTIAGTGESGFSGDDGPATAAQLNIGSDFRAGFVHGIVIDAEGNLYIADSGNARVRKIDTQGIITTFAGDGGQAIAGDGGPATAATLSLPLGLAIDVGGNLYVTETNSNFISNTRVRRIDSDGIITTVVGTGEGYFSGDGGPATSATLTGPAGIAFDPQGSLYIVDAGNSRIRKVDTNGIITTVVGGQP